jgi:hypothetical protein
MFKPFSKLSKTTTTAACLLAASGCVSVNAKTLDYKDTRDLTLSTTDVKRLTIDAGAGFLKIIGEPGLNEVKVTAEILAENEDIKLTLKRSGDEIELEADANQNSYFNWRGESPKIDLTVRVPQRLMLQVKDGSGSMTIEDINNDVTVNDGSGSMKIKNIKGNLNVDDGSGSLDILNITGNLVVEDGSGSLDISQVTGTVNVDDGSGSLAVYDIGGLVTIDDGSGSIHVKKLRNGLTILEEGSGGLKMSDVEGPVSIK